MNCDCIICRRNKADLVTTLIDEGKDFKQILTELRKSHRVSDGVLAKHLRLTGNAELIPAKPVISDLVNYIVNFKIGVNTLFFSK